jgi:dTDP-4-amino-4,6-dideoxygalactose transaminase
LVNSQGASACSVLLPLYPQMTTAEQDEVLEALFQLDGARSPVAAVARSHS